MDTDAAIEKDPFFSMCAAAKNDPKVREKLEKVPISVVLVHLAILTLPRASMLLVTTLHNTTIARLELDRLPHI